MDSIRVNGKMVGRRRVGRQHVSQFNCWLFCWVLSVISEPIINSIIFGGIYFLFVSDDRELKLKLVDYEI